MAKHWIGSAPATCDVCGHDIVGAFVDGVHYTGSWATFCLRCHQVEGSGLGTGKGQKYVKQPDGSWLKTEG